MLETKKGYCPNECGATMTHTECIAHLRDACPYRQVKCNNEGCTESFCVGDEEKHYETCKYQIVKCTAPVCYHKCLRKDLENHLNTECEKNYRECPETNCTVKGCGAQLAVHAKYCLVRMVECPVPGCDHMCTAAGMGQHLNYDKKSKAKHIKLAGKVGYVGTIESQIKELQKKLEFLNSAGKLRVELEGKHGTPYPHWYKDMVEDVRAKDEVERKEVMDGICTRERLQWAREDYEEEVQAREIDTNEEDIRAMQYDQYKLYTTLKRNDKTKVQLRKRAHTKRLQETEVRVPIAGSAYKFKSPQKKDRQKSKVNPMAVNAPWSPIINKRTRTEAAGGSKYYIDTSDEAMNDIAHIGCRFQPENHRESIDDTNSDPMVDLIEAEMDQE